MTTLITQEKDQRMRIHHHPARYHDPQAEAEWRAKQRQRRLLRVMLVLAWVSFVFMMVTLYLRRAL